MDRPFSRKDESRFGLRWLRPKIRSGVPSQGTSGLPFVNLLRQLSAALACTTLVFQLGRGWGFGVHTPSLVSPEVPPEHDEWFECLGSSTQYESGCYGVGLSETSSALWAGPSYLADVC
jgi:hypothetical protein